ncbi:hypothetical protein GE253_11545 [Niveispirillum sp. SYP-B3756]|uniref:hypothetical protein n=1 Tax=Niveispirillum sp. SYP-B3756 TaxID=2662178 RepID=UPI0012925BB1|nr:hypothetical protein [Niveispirillum sp. SYP-B3756]MQP65973.1 hypothetical protein [Niveispirillum sp. SYP-B3756]
MSMLLKSFQANTLRNAQPITAIRHGKPRRIGMWVMPVHQAWSGDGKGDLAAGAAFKTVYAALLQGAG